MAKKKAKKKEVESGFSRMLAGTVALGIVFSAGLITGQRLLRAESRAPMVSLSTTRAAPDTPDGVEAAKPSLRTTFSFYEHLTNDAEAASPPPAPAVVDPKAEPAEAAAPKPEPAKPESPKVDAPKVEAPKPAPVKVEAAKPAAPPAAQPAPPAVVEKPVAPAVVEKPVAPVVVEEKAPEPKAMAARYTLQVSSHPDRTSAEREVARLSQMGVEPHVVVVNVPGKGELWRVRVGKFHSMDEARDFQGTVKARRGVAGFVTPL